jgi:phenylalanyl-tRNA synthetase beta chain
MQVPVSWLKEYVDVSVPVEELAQRLTLAGLEVETIEYIGLPQAELPWDPERIVVGEVRVVQQHPNADRLVVVEVDYGGAETERVVTGAPSLLELEGQRDLHLKVAFAMEGSRLYDGHAEGARAMTLRQVKIRGVPSRAMVCSEKELGLSEEQIDILYLPDDAPVGTPLVEYMGDAVLEFDIKGPFAHLNSVIGVAREAAALLDVPLQQDALEVLDRHLAQRMPPLTPDPDFLFLDIADPDLCPRYSAAFITGVDVKPSPFWMQMRLRRAGVRPINNIVDVTNYVMLELGQPLHAFDYQLLQPRPAEERPAIIVRRAQPGEQMRTLDGQLRTFDEHMLLITDGGGPVAVAGVMGGEESEVSEGTTEVLLESANFNYLNVRRTSRELGLSSESSQRFGRRVDPQLTVKAAARAAHLMADLAGGTVAPVIRDLYPGRKPEQQLSFHPAYAARILGVEIPRKEIARILKSLAFDVSELAGQEALKVTVPSHRRDVTRPVDLVEEVGRIWGYDRFPTTLMRDELPPQRENARLEGAERVRDVLTGCGLDEVITYSLVSLEDEGKLHPGEPLPDPEDYLQLRNPLSSEQATLRQSLLPSLLDTTHRNLRFVERVTIFEIGRVYIPTEGEVLPDEPRRLGIVITGPREGRSWLEHQDRTWMDFFDLKGIVEALLSRLGLDGAFEPAEHHAFHPGRCASVLVGGDGVGVMGELHPLVREAFGLPEQPLCAFTCDLDALLAPWGAAREMMPLSTHPPVYEDLAVVVRRQVSASRVRDCITRAGGTLLRSVALFDVYRGAQVGAGKKSLAYRLTYQAEDRTLTDEEVAEVRATIIQELEQELGATLRS